MIVVRFSIAVAKNQVEETQKDINEFGIEIIRTHEYNEKCMETVLPSERIYFDCYAPVTRLKMLTEYLEKDTTKTVILSY